MILASTLRLSFDRDHLTHRVDAPTKQDIQEAVQRLDGKRFSEVAVARFVDGHEVASLLFGGGGEDLVLVVIFHGNSTWFEGREFTEAAGTVTMLAGGQKAEFERRDCISKAKARAVVDAFLETGALSDALRWTETQA